MATTQNNPARPATLIRWGPVFAGAVIGVAVLALLVSLFAAIGGEATGVADNLHWFGLGSAVVALFIAGLLAGWLSGVRGAGSGLFHGITAWGLILVAAVIVPFPAELGVWETFAAPVEELGTGALWATFLSLAGGLILAAIGGLIGGAMSRPMAAAQAPEPEAAAPAAAPMGAGRPEPEPTTRRTLEEEEAAARRQSEAASRGRRQRAR